PDSEKWFVYYNTPVKILRLLKQLVFQQNNMGKFWSKEELDFIVQKYNAFGEMVVQPDSFPYAHYRMDYLIRKGN
ncbi:MAG: hypothetical protein V4651_04075, partial [Bacteroidota bacterium]